MVFQVRIIDENKGVIEFGPKDSKEAEAGTGGDAIQNVEIKFDTIDDDVDDRAEALLAKVTITGLIGGSTNEDVKKLFRWALSNSKKEIYREIDITLWDSDVEMRNYIFKRMFVVDYEELLVASGSINSKEKKLGDTNAKDKSVFRLYLTQEKKNLSTIESY